MAIRYEIDERIVVVTIDRPDVANAIDRPTAEALADAFRQFEADDSLAVAVLTDGDEPRSTASGDYANFRAGRG